MADARSENQFPPQDGEAVPQPVHEDQDDLLAASSEVDAELAERLAAEAIAAGETFALDASSADVEAMRQIDQDLAKRADQAMHSLSAEADDADLDGEFLSQDEMSRIMAEEVGCADEGAAARAVQTDEPTGPAEANSAGDPAAVAAEPGPKQPDDAAVVSADDLEAAAPDVAEAAADAVGQVSQADKPAPAQAAVEPSAGQKPATETAFAQPVPRPPFHVRWLAAVLNSADKPFRRVPVQIKNAIGLIAAATWLAGIAVWVVSFLIRC